MRRLYSEMHMQMCWPQQSGGLQYLNEAVSNPGRKPKYNDGNKHSVSLSLSLVVAGSCTHTYTVGGSEVHTMEMFSKDKRVSIAMCCPDVWKLEHQRMTSAMNKNADCCKETKRYRWQPEVQKIKKATLVQKNLISFKSDALYLCMYLIATCRQKILPPWLN